jgi:hypothetical protein
MGSLVEAVKDSTKRPLIIADCTKMIDQEVKDKSGFTGIAVKGGFKAIRGFSPDIVPKALEDLIDEFAVQIEPFWQDCQNNGEDAQRYFVRRKVDIANALLSITDGKANKSKHKILVKAYKALRGKAIDHIGASMPRFAEIVKRHAS